MNCEQIERAMLGMGMAELLHPLRSGIRQHLTDCHRCDELRLLWTELTRDLTRGAEFTPPAGFWDEFFLQVLNLSQSNRSSKFEAESR